MRCTYLHSDTVGHTQLVRRKQLHVSGMLHTNQDAGLHMDGCSIHYSPLSQWSPSQLDVQEHSPGVTHVPLCSHEGKHVAVWMLKSDNEILTAIYAIYIH